MKKYDITGIGNALVDIQAEVEDSFLAANHLPKASMQLVDAETATSLYESTAVKKIATGGSAANSLAIMAQLGCSCAFIGQTGDDTLGQEFAHALISAGIEFRVAPLAGAASGQCFVGVTPDGQRTMATYLGASIALAEAQMDAALITESHIVYLEGYLWDSDKARPLMHRAIEVAQAAGGKCAFTLSDAFCVQRHAQDFWALLKAGKIDILFCNETELLAMGNTQDVEAAIAQLQPHVPLLLVTLGEHGAWAVTGGETHRFKAQENVQVVDTTGAGDAFAAGFLAGLAQGKNTQACGEMGIAIASEIISHFGTRLESDVAGIFKLKA
jgi:sugar/nucleoside kinase (ribokinase family)